MTVLALNAPFAKTGIYQMLGRRLGRDDVDPDKKYAIFLPPGVLFAAASSFRSVPIIDDHVPCGEFDDAVIFGCTGPDVLYKQGKLWTEHRLWHRGAIADAKDGVRRHLSIGFLSDFDMESGEFEGVSYEGMILHLQGDHVALVEKGDAGEACSLPRVPAWSLDAAALEP